MNDFASGLNVKCFHKRKKMYGNTHTSSASHFQKNYFKVALIIQMCFWKLAFIPSNISTVTSSCKSCANSSAVVNSLSSNLKSASVVFNISSALTTFVASSIVAKSKNSFNVATGAASNIKILSATSSKCSVTSSYKFSKNSCN